MSDAAAFPRDDRAWPRGAFAACLLCGVGALVASAVLVATADSWRQAAELLVVFLAMAGLEAASYVDAVTAWLEGSPLPARAPLIQGALLVVAFAMFALGASVGAAALLGLMAGVFVPTAWAIRHVRMSRGLAAASEMTLTVEETVDQGAPSSGKRATARRTPRVGPVLREAMAESRARWLAWAAATVVSVVLCAASQAPSSVVVTVGLVGGCAMVWVAQELVGLRVAVRDFERATAVPTRAYVVLLNDPRPRVNRPLLGIWSEEPVPEAGRLPAAEAVYRCEAGRAALPVMEDTAVVHEAWVDTGPRARSSPRWVAADAGVVLPRRRALLGRQTIDSLVGDERPARARPLTMRAPHPATERTGATVLQVITEEAPATGRGFRLFAVRLALLVLVAVVLAWLASSLS